MSPSPVCCSSGRQEPARRIWPSRRCVTLIARGFEGVFFDFQSLLNRIRSGYDAASGTMDRKRIERRSKPRSWCSTIWARIA